MSVSQKGSNRPILYYRGRKIERFFTNDSKLYLTNKELEMMAGGSKPNRSLKRWDSISSRIVSDYKNSTQREHDFLYEKFKQKYEEIQEEIEYTSGSIARHFSIQKLWNLSIVASMLFGMFSMTLIYRYLGQGASAGAVNLVATQAAIEMSVEKPENGSEDDENSYIRKFFQETSESKSDLENEIREMVKGYPIEEMVPYIAEKDRMVAAFLVGIAKKESNWGKRVPLLNGQDCYNYWGYRGIRKLMGTGGHTCFNSRKDAVDTVAKRIDWLIKNEELDTPKEMVIWKCGSDCNATGGWAAANKWISDVNKYFERLNKESD